MKRALTAAVLALAACSPAAQKAPEAPPAPEATAPTPVVTLGALSIDSAIVRPPVEGQTTGAGFLTVRNGGEADRLLAASSPATSSIELHTHRHVDGMMRMEKVDAVDIAAGGATVFEPGGLHLMMFGLAPTGDTVPVTLKFEKGGEVTVPFNVMARSAEEGETGQAEPEEEKH
jgi:copper(I)-binding protein